MTDASIVAALFCANPHCLVGHWLVTVYSAANQVWRVVAYFEETPFLVAAPSPICPCCGAQLLTPLAVDGGFVDDVQMVDEQGPLFDFIRTLN